eukprot:jgi/Chrpa1/24668/Chrysochromulina_OHIO_Genome00009089-RA
MLYKTLLPALAAVAAGQQTCETLRDAFQSNECCASNMGKQLETPLSIPTADSIAAMPSVFDQFLHMSANFTLFGTQSKSIMSTFKPVGTHTAHICEATDAAYS